MSSALWQSMLRLPTCIRRQALTETLSFKSVSMRQEHLMLGRRLYATGSRNMPKAPRYRKPASLSQAPPRAAPKAPPTQGYQRQAYIESLVGDGEEVLLYRAPSHRTFSIMALSTGAALLLGAFNYAVIAYRAPLSNEKTWTARITYSVSLLSTLVMSAIATAALLAPAATIRSIRLRSPHLSANGGRGPTTLLFKVRGPPFARAHTIEMKPGEALLDRKVSAVDMEMTSIAPINAGTFTASTAEHAPSVVNPEQAALARAWEALALNVRRMLMRDGFAYIRLGQNGQNWKLDLQHCEILDWGNPLQKMTNPADHRTVGLFGWVRRRFAPSQS